MSTTTATLVAAVHEAVRSVDDPEYPGVSIADLGLVESVEVRPDGSVDIGLIPTFSGCPALRMIADDVRAVVERVGGVTNATVDWLTTPVWSIERVSDEARATLAQDFTVAVQIGRAPPTCPRCGTPTEEQSVFGPSRCRSVHRCPACAEPVEVMRS